jgi:hypothetical protein
VISVSRRTDVMRKWEAAIATENPKILYQAVQLLKAMEIDFVICHPTDSRCNDCHVVITDTPDILEQREQLVLVQENFDVDYVQIEVMARLMKIKDPTKAFIGIDPGMTFGVALVIDGVVLYHSSLIAPSAVVTLVSHLSAYVKTLFFGCQSIIRIGTGSKLYSVILLRALLQKSDNLNIELVNEKNTTTPGGPRPDESAAILIAGRPGRTMTASDIVLEAKAGYIRSIKQFVTRLTKGKRVLTLSEAQSILLGEVSIDDALLQTMP